MRLVSRLTGYLSGTFSKNISPFDGVIKPVIICPIVVLPLPLSPIKPSVSFLFMQKLIFLIASKSFLRAFLYVLEMFLSSSIFPAPHLPVFFYFYHGRGLSAFFKGIFTVRCISASCFINGTLHTLCLVL